MSKLVYLAGPINGCTYDECVDWRDCAIRELSADGIIGVSPMRGKEFLKNYPKIADKISDHVLVSDSGITNRDMWDVRRCDTILFNLLGAKQVSIGAMIEYGWASAFDKQIVTIMEKDGSVHEHLMVRRLSSYRVETLESGLAIVKSLFNY